jgi:hypothetical protein
MFEMFLLRKINREAEAAKVPEELDAVLWKFRKLMRDNSENDFSPEDCHNAPSADD